MHSRIALGTAQLGLGYGVANRTGQLSRHEAAATLDLARRHGMDTLDTAIAYGNSEERLGEIGVSDWRIVSKLPAVPEGCRDVAGWVREQIDGSLARLGVTRLYGVLLHRPAQLRNEYGDALHRALHDLKEAGLAEKIGISIYEPDELGAIRDYPVDLIQSPFSVFDQRLLSSGWLERLHAQGVEVHVRSIFLQGLLLMHPRARPPYFARWEPQWRKWDQWLEREGVSALRACLAFALAQQQIARVVVGVDGRDHLEQLLSAVEGPRVSPPMDLACEDSALVNPSQWKTS